MSDKSQLLAKSRAESSLLEFCRDTKEGNRKVTDAFIAYLVSENLSDTPKSLVEVGYDEADTTGMLV